MIGAGSDAVSHCINEFAFWYGLGKQPMKALQFPSRNGKKMGLCSENQKFVAPLLNDISFWCEPEVSKGWSLII
jgi:hypothetical protein